MKQPSHTFLASCRRCIAAVLRAVAARIEPDPVVTEAACRAALEDLEQRIMGRIAAIRRPPFQRSAQWSDWDHRGADSEAAGGR